MLRVPFLLITSRNVQMHFKLQYLQFPLPPEDCPEGVEVALPSAAAGGLPSVAGVEGYKPFVLLHLRLILP